MNEKTRLMMQLNETQNKGRHILMNGTMPLEHQGNPYSSREIRHQFEREKKRSTKREFQKGEGVLECFKK